MSRWITAGLAVAILLTSSIPLYAEEEMNRAPTLEDYGAAVSTIYEATERKDYYAAVDRSLEALEVAEALFGEDHIEVGRLNCLVGTLHYNIDPKKPRSVAATRYLNRCIEIVDGRDIPLLIDAHHTLVRIYYRLGRTGPFREHQRLEAELRATAGDNDLSHLLVMRKLVPPDHPKDAARRRQEGWVKLSFTVDKKGFPEDIVVLDAEPEGVFDRAAIAAAKRIRYEPLLLDGVPQRILNVKRVYNFKIK